MRDPKNVTRLALYDLDRRSLLFRSSLISIFMSNRIRSATIVLAAGRISLKLANDFDHQVRIIPIDQRIVDASDIIFGKSSFGE